MTHLLIISDDSITAAALRAALGKSGFSAATASYKDALETAARTSPHLLLAEINGHYDASRWQSVIALKKKRELPVIALVSETALASLDTHREVDDFIITPCNDVELSLRINRLLRSSAADSENSEQIKCSGLTIDLATCEVTVHGSKVDLTFKEYELLKLMASNKGRVFTREALLDKIWGYDYFGGDRTVDVHVRRLRSKIEDVDHTYIETVRNIGYKFIKNE
ncbi:MAG: hypothetical protein A2Y90_03490 [Chloroflexi bacterium RBG_13_52_12]|nr:MAG: hypothetical protein A2Y90_03490 [Chloroflexi bacterium RBG_13_52_12]